MANSKLDKSKLFGFAQASQQGAKSLKSDQAQNFLSKIGGPPGEFPPPRVRGKK